MIMGLESSGTPITGDSIKTKLLQDIQHQASGRSTENDSAFYVKNNRHNFQKAGNKNNFESRGPRCYAYNKYGHMASCCPDPNSKPKGQNHQKPRGQRKSHDTQRPNHYKAFIALGAQEKADAGSWYIVSGASCHMSCHKEWFYTLDENYRKDIEVADHGILTAAGIGKIQVQIKLDDDEDTVDVTDVLYIPDLSTNLLSVSQLIRKGLRVNFDADGCRIIDRSGNLMATATNVNKLYRLDCQQDSALSAKVNTKEDL